MHRTQDLSDLQYCTLATSVGVVTGKGNCTNMHSSVVA